MIKYKSSSVPSRHFLKGSPLMSFFIYELFYYYFWSAIIFQIHQFILLKVTVPVLSNCFELLSSFQFLEIKKKLGFFWQFVVWLLLELVFSSTVTLFVTRQVYRSYKTILQLSDTEQILFTQLSSNPACLLKVKILYF